MPPRKSSARFHISLSITCIHVSFWWPENCCIIITRNTPIGVVLREPPAVNHLVVHIQFLVWELSEIGTTRAAKVVSSDSPPSICYTALQSSEYLKPPGCRERFSIFVGVCPQNWGLGALRGAKVIPSLLWAFLYFRGVCSPKLRFGGS